MCWRNFVLKNFKLLRQIIYIHLLFFAVFLFVSLSVFAAEDVQKLNINAQNGAILINAETGDVIYEKEADKIAPMASTTKIMTTLLALEQGNLDEPFVIDSNAIKIEGSSMGLKEGDCLTIRDLCYGMMLPSGNDAANVLATKIAGSIDGFVKMMNLRAKELGLKNTHFCTPSGLDTSEKNEHHSTARDMALLTQKAMENADFCEICSQSYKKLTFGNPPINRVIRNHNRLLKEFDGACGVKTGFTKKAGRCLVSAAQRDGLKLIAVVLKDHDDWQDSKNLFEYGFSKFSLKELPSDFSDVKLNLAGQYDKTFYVKPERVLKIHATSEMIENIKMQVKTDPFYFLPIEQGDVVGEVEYFLNGKSIGKINLCADLNRT